MDKLVSTFQAFPPNPPPQQPLPDAQYESQIRSLLSSLNKTTVGQLKQTTNDGILLLDLLNPSLNTLPYLFCLIAHSISCQDKDLIGSTALPVRIDPRGPFWARAINLLENCDGRQIRYVGNEWRRLVNGVAQSARAINEPILAIPPIRQAILQIDPTSRTLTSTHVLFLRLCLEARAFDAAIPIVDHDIVDYPVANHAMLTSHLRHSTHPYLITINSGVSARLTYADPLLYQLYRAMIYIGLKKWERAVEVLQYVTTTGSQNAPSMIMVAAYKKLVLVSLLRSGRGPRLPRLTNVVERVYQALARPYDRIAEVFAQGNHDILWQEIQAGQPIWEADRNVGLIHLVLNALPVFLVRRYAKTYSTISIAQVSDWLSRGNSHAASASASNDLSAVEERIAQMISSGEILARLSRHPSAALASPTHKHSTAANSTTTTIPSYSSPPPPPPHPSSTITFSPLDPDTTILNASETSHAAQLKAQLCRLNQLSAQLKVIDSKLAFSKEFVAHTIKSNPSDRPHKGNRSVHQGAGPATGEDDYMHDAPSFPSGWGAPRANAGGGGGGGDADGGGSSRPYNGAGSFADEVFDEDVMADL